ncbi:MAG: hypothetical protein MUC72_01405 [Acidobacteria bacterium]|jgi:hypothetical protein|nr:hypothetical protein [Acidobacteriota bacterium]
MSSPSLKLYRLRGIFIVYYILKSIAGAVIAFGVLRPIAVGRYGLQEWSPGALAVFSLAITALILWLAWLVFGQLLQRRNWARVLLLVIGWLTVISAIASLLLAPQASAMGSWLSRWVAPLGLDWQKLLAYDRVQKVFELLFWGYLISVLQFDQAVRDEFFPGPDAKDAPPER